MTDERLLQGMGEDLDAEVSGEWFRRRGDDGKLLLPYTRRDFLISRFLRARSKEGGMVLLEPNRVQRAYAARCSKRNIVLKARQLGMSTYIAARYFIQTITRPGTLTVQVAHSQEAAEELFGIVRRFWEKLPRRMQRGVLKTSHANVRQLVFPRIDSEYRVEAADGNAGRGLTIHNLHCSEVARWARGAEEALASLRSAVPPGGEIVLESTPNGAAGLFYEEWQRAEETGYTKHFFPWWFDKDYVIPPGKGGLGPLTREEEELMQRHGVTAPQIAFRRVRWAQLRSMAPQEFAEDDATCFRASSECIFDVESLERVLAATSEPLEMKDNRRLMVWFPQRPGHEYIVGMDPAGGGTEGDFACIEVIDRTSGMQCAEWRGHAPLREQATQARELGRRFNDALIAVERNNHGHGALAYLRSDGYPNIYQERGNDGWLTSVVSRPIMIAHLSAVLMEAPMLFHSPRLLNECRTFVRHPDGNAAAAAGSHDDCVMAMAIAWAVRRELAGMQRRAVSLGYVGGLK